MKFLARFPWKALAFLSVVAFLASRVVTAAMAEPQTEVRQSDVQAAQRVELAPEGTVDFRVPPAPVGVVGAMGLVEPASPETRVSFAEPGVLSVLHVTEGDFVPAGTLLAELESALEQGAVVTASAELEVAAAELLRASAGLRRERVDAIEAEREAARARAAASADALARTQRLHEQAVASDRDLEQATRAAEADAAEVDRISAVLREARSGSREDVAVAEAQVAVAQARLEEAQARLARRRVVAPTDGEVLEIPWRVGEYVLPGESEPLMRIGDTRTLRARLDVDERDIAAVVVGARVTLVADAWPDREFAGTVVDVAQRMGRKNVRTDEPIERIDTKILEVVVEVEASDGLVPGQRVMGYIGGVAR